MISLKERMVISTVTSAIAFVVFGMVMIGTGMNLYPAMIGFVLGSFGFQLVVHAIVHRQRHSHR